MLFYSIVQKLKFVKFRGKEKDMREINGVEVLKEMLKIEKKKYQFEQKLNKTKFFGNDIELNFGYSITDIIAKILKLPKETEIPLEADGDEIYKITQQDDFVSYDWLINTIYDYFDDEINLEETIKYLLEE